MVQEYKSESSVQVLSVCILLYESWVAEAERIKSPGPFFVLNRVKEILGWELYR